VQIIITSDDISWAESILLPDGEHFDGERQAVIKCLETKDILACPGSGKTTALIAKLLILSRKMPFQNNRGICVLTHTNVAINEIKKHASFASQKLFNYPNHFGTIQSFVDKYFAIPSYVLKYNKRPGYIDTDVFNSVIDRSYNTLHAARNWLERKREGGLDYLKRLRFNKDNFYISTSIDEQEFIGITTTTYREINTLKLRILEWGYLSFEDAYSLAFRYIREHPGIRDLLSKRFAYIFIDEMQDSSKIQSELLNNAFNDNVVMQKIGDLNQSIFDHDATLECGWVVNGDRIMRITGSKRFTGCIARKIENLCITKQSISGNECQDEITPVIIAYSDDTINRVLDKFGEIIIRNNLHQNENKVFKAVGWRGKPHEVKRTISSYWGGYLKEIKTDKTDFDDLYNYLAYQTDELVIFKGANFYKRRIVGAFLKCLRIANITNDEIPFTEYRLNKYLSEKYLEFYKDYRVRLATWCLKIHKKIDVFEEIKNYLTKEFKEIFDHNVNEELSQFLNSSMAESGNVESPPINNIYKYSDGVNELEIEVSTIHSVKGETHTATCYLETFYKKYDIKRILDYIKGEYSSPTKTTVIQNLKMAFVGMSRPSHLLCIAVHSDSISGQEEELRKNGWDIDDSLCMSLI
jgi:hypothetical protein